MQGTVGFELELQPSRIPHESSGLGVFIKHTPTSSATSPSVPVVCPGTVVALFPGLVHLNEPVSLSHYSNPNITLKQIFDFTGSGAGADAGVSLKDQYIRRELLPDPDYRLLMRLDGVFIDSRGGTGGGAGRGGGWLGNPYALAHCVNHPPLASTSHPGTGTGGRVAVPPNVIQVCYTPVRIA